MFTNIRIRNNANKTTATTTTAATKKDGMKSIQHTSHVRLRRRRRFNFFWCVVVSLYSLVRERVFFAYAKKPLLLMSHTCNEWLRRLHDLVPTHREESRRGFSFFYWISAIFHNKLVHRASFTTGVETSFYYVNHHSLQRKNSTNPPVLFRDGKYGIIRQNVKTAYDAMAFREVVMESGGQFFQCPWRDHKTREIHSSRILHCQLHELSWTESADRKSFNACCLLFVCRYWSYVKNVGLFVSPARIKLQLNSIAKNSKVLVRYRFD